VDRVAAARQKLAKSQAALEGFQVAYDRAAQLAEAAKHKCEEAVEQHSHLEEAWGWEQQRLDEIKHRFAHNGGVERMCDIQKAAGGVLEALLSMAAQNGPEGSEAFQEEFQALLRKAGALHAHCVPGSVAQVPPVEPGDQKVVGPVGQPKPGESGPTQAAALQASPKRAREQSDADPVQTGSEAEQEAAADVMQEDHSCEKEDSSGDKVMVDEERRQGKAEGQGQARGAQGQARPRREGCSGGHPEEGSVASLQGPVGPGQDDAPQDAAAESTLGPTESKKAAKRAAKAAAKQRAKVRKQGKK